MMRVSRAADGQPRFHPDADAEDRGSGAAAGRSRARSISIFSISGFGSNTSSGCHHADPGAVGPARPRSQQQIAAAGQPACCSRCPACAPTSSSPTASAFAAAATACSSRSPARDYAELADDRAKDRRPDEQGPQDSAASTVNYNATQPQLTLSIDRDKAAALGIDINGLGTTMQAMIDGARSAQVFVERCKPIRCAWSRPPRRSTIRAISRASSSRRGTAATCRCPRSRRSPRRRSRPRSRREQQRRDVSVTASARWRLCARRRLSARAADRRADPARRRRLHPAAGRSQDHRRFQQRPRHHLRLCAGGHPAGAVGAVRKRLRRASSSWSRCRSGSPAPSMRCCSPAAASTSIRRSG